MLVIIKSAPDSAEGKRGVSLAMGMAADLCLIQNGVYFARHERPDGFCGRVYVLDEDLKLRGLGDGPPEGDLKKIDYDDLIDLMVSEDKVVGMF